MTIGVNKSKIIIALFFIVTVVGFISSTFNLIDFVLFNNWFYLSSSLIFIWLYLNPKIIQTNIQSKTPPLVQTKAWYLVPVAIAVFVLGFVFA